MANPVYACYSDGDVVDLLRRGEGLFAIAIDPVIASLKNGSVATDGIPA